MKPKRVANFVFYDAEWQFPAITEQHAFARAKVLLPKVPGVVYFAFPWATLIDLLHLQKPAGNRLRKILSEAGTLLQSGERVVTVCQHILMLNYQNMFAETGITDVFWSHAISVQKAFPENPHISVRPFPLYPVQAINDNNDSDRPRPILYSFVGARANNKWYLTQSRTHILDLLEADKRGTVIGRDVWHYNRVVYDHQINEKQISSDELVDKTASDEFKSLLKSSVFSLCPSGSGPNSIRLWESIGLGAIPVVLSDTYWPPGNQALWQNAAVFCKETEGAISALPDRLEALARNQALLTRKRHSMRQLWMLYGPECFIYDVEKLFVELAAMPQIERRTSPPDTFAPLIAEVTRLDSVNDLRPEFLGPFILGCSMRAISDPDGFSRAYRDDALLRNAISKAMKHGNPKHTSLLLDVMRHKQVVFE